MAELNNPLRSPNDGKIGLPSVQAGMNRRGPKPDIKPDKDDFRPLGQEEDEEKDADILDRIRKRMDRCIAWESENRKDAVDDLKFKAGQQWPADVASQRNTDRRPCLTINKLPTFIHQVTNDQRQNRPSINVSPVGDKGDKDVAKMYCGMIRQIERASSASIAYDTAFEGAVSNGFGYFRLLTEWEDPDSFDQVIAIKRIRNPFTVYLDPDHTEPDGADCRYGFISEIIPLEEFKETYPDASPISFDMGGQGEKWKNWSSKDGIRVAEYYEIKVEMRDLVELSNGFVGWKDELSGAVKLKLKNGDFKVRRERKAESTSVKYYKVTAIEILERNDWLGQWIPIIPVIGNEIDIEGKVRLSGLIRGAKDAQRMYNYWKPQSLDTPIPTPSGWSALRDIHEGSVVFNEDGRPVRVLGESPTYINRDCFKVVFDDGCEVVADAEHPWPVEERGKRKAATWDWSQRIARTDELTPGKHFIHTAKPLELPSADLPVHPYALGVWLGDGSSVSPVITQSQEDIGPLRSELELAGQRLGPIRGKARDTFSILGIAAQLKAIGVIGNKHIPPSYLRASQEQRMALLQGLMDTDGAIGESRQCSFTTTLPALADGFRELLRSLGIKAVSQKRSGRAFSFANGGCDVGADFEQFSFSPGGQTVFRLSRKADRCESKASRRTKRHRIVSVERVPSVPVKCIMVDTPSHLYLCGDAMIPTHNTSETELIALAPKAPFIVEEGQIEGHERQWKNANTRSYPYLSYKGTSVAGHPAPPPQRQPFAQIPAGVANAALGAAQDMMATTGIRFDATMQERTVDESGRALRELQRKGDVGSFHYFDNLCRSLKHCGRQLIDLIPKVYDEARMLTILREDNTEEQVKLDPNANKPYEEKRVGEDGKKLKIFNPTYGKYGVTVDIGPSYASKRIEAAESMMEFVRALPNTAALIADLIAKNQDWPGADEMAARLAKAVPPNLLTSDQKDVAPQIQALIQNLEQQVQQLHQQLSQAMAALNDKDKDRDIAREKISADFEAKILAVMQKTEAEQLRANAEIARMVAEKLLTPPAEAGQQTEQPNAG